MDLQKDELLELEITDMATDGSGIGRADGIALFVKDAVIGDRVLAKVMKMKKNYGYAKLVELKSPSPYRVEPRCAQCAACGGCQLQALSYEKQLEFKQNQVLNNLRRIGGFAGPEELLMPIVGMEEPFSYRNKAQYPIGLDKNGHVVAGFYASRTHHIVPCGDCQLGAPADGEVLRVILAFMEENLIAPYDENTGKGLVRHVLIRSAYATGEVMACLVVNGTRLPKSQELVERLRQIPGMASILLNVNRKNTNVILGEKQVKLWGQDYITDKIGDLCYRISPQSFYQVNPVQTKRLYELALEYADLTGSETVWDLYCGIGTISLFLARRAKQVYGVEVVPAAIRNARDNARLNHIENVCFLQGAVEEVLSMPGRQAHGADGQDLSGQQMPPADVVVVDPPRKGCDERCLEAVARMRPKRIVYVSCDSATLARDLKYLCGNGYELRRAQPVDMFPQTVAVETVCALSRME